MICRFFKSIFVILLSFRGYFPQSGKCRVLFNKSSLTCLIDLNTNELHLCPIFFSYDYIHLHRCFLLYNIPQNLIDFC